MLYNQTKQVAATKGTQKPVRIKCYSIIIFSTCLLKPICTCTKPQKVNFFLEFISILKLGKPQAVFSKTKLKGISSLSLICLLLVFPFINQTSVYAYTKSYSFERKKELNTSKIEMAIKMIKRAVKHNITADYVLTDSWFICRKLVEVTLKNNMNYIGMYSISKTLFTYRNNKLTYA